MNSIKSSIWIALWSIIFISSAAAQSTNQTQKFDSAAHLVQIKKIFILGNEKTKRHIITRELRFQEGEYLILKDLDEILELSRINVYNTNLFESVEIHKLMSDSASLDVLIKLEERWYVWPSFTLKPVDRNLIDWWTNRDRDFSRVRFGPKLDVYNVGGRKEALKFIGLFGFDKRFITQYTIPYIDKSQKHGLTIGGSWLVNKNLAVDNINNITQFISDTLDFKDQVNRNVYRGYLEYRFRPSFNNYHYLTLDAYSMNISQELAAFNPNYYGNGRTEQKVAILLYTFIRDKRNNRNYPLSGYYLLGQFQKTGLGIFRDVNLSRLAINAQYFKDLNNKWYLSTSIAGQISTRNNVPYFNRTEFGEGTYYVRGFERYVIQGPHNILSRNSLKYQLLSTKLRLNEKSMPIKKFRKLPFQVYPKLFFDYGYVVNYPDYEVNSRLTDKSIYSVGLGLDLVMLYDMTLRLETSYNSEGKIKFAPNFLAEFQL